MGNTHNIGIGFHPRLLIRGAEAHIEINEYATIAFECTGGTQ
jgi:hypothetical protein